MKKNAEVRMMNDEITSGFLGRFAFSVLFSSLLLVAGCINPVFNLNTPLVINRGVSVASAGPARGTNGAVNVMLTVEGGGLAGASAAVAGRGAAAAASPSPVGGL